MVQRYDVYLKVASFLYKNYLKELNELSPGDCLRELHPVFFNNCQYFGLSTFVHLNAKVDKYNKTYASNVWIDHARHGEGIVDAMSQNWSKQHAYCNLR